MTWPPPPPASDPWESRAAVPGEPPPPEPERRDDAEPQAAEPPTFESGWDTPTGARAGQFDPAEPPFPVPAFDPDWGSEADAPAPDGSHDSGGTTVAWEVQPATPADPDAAAEPGAAPPRDDAWETPSDPVIQPMADEAEATTDFGWNAADASPTGERHAPVAPQWQEAAAPVPAAGPPPEYTAADGRWSELYHAPPPVVPRPGPRAIPLRWLLIGGGTLLAIIVIVVLAVVLLRPSPAAETATTTTTTEVAVDPEAQDRLSRALPRGYPDQACAPDRPSGAAVARVTCERNTDPGGPDTSTYTLYEDQAALDAAFASLVDASQVVVCPGRIQSPGPWRRNATPDKVSGTLLCALDRNRPSISWTDLDDLVIGTVEVRPGATTFDQLYAWWAAHS